MKLAILLIVAAIGLVYRPSAIVVIGPLVVCFLVVRALGTVGMRGASDGAIAYRITLMLFVFAATLLYVASRVHFVPH